MIILSDLSNWLPIPEFGNKEIEGREGARVKLMVPTLDGDSELGAHVWSDLSYLICLRHLFKNSHRFSPKISIFHHACAS